MIAGAFNGLSFSKSSEGVFCQSLQIPRKEGREVCREGVCLDAI